VKALLRAELLKLRTTRTFVALTAAAVGASLLVVVLTAALVHRFSEQEIHDLFSSDFTGLFILLLGVMGIAGEWRHRTITSTVLAAPDRVKLLAAKLLSYAAAGIVVSLVVTVAIMAVGSLVLELGDKQALGLSGLLDVLWRNLLTAAFLGGFGVVIGTLIRNQVVAIVGLLIFGFAVEPALLGLAPDVGRFGPTVGAPSGIQGLSGFSEEDLLAPAVAILVMVGWIGVGFAAGAALLRRRDLT
jgi:ABC-type transport system involved in multi-copper enzyme maturation permease subunit